MKRDDQVNIKAKKGVIKQRKENNYLFILFVCSNKTTERNIKCTILSKQKEIEIVLKEKEKAYIYSTADPNSKRIVYHVIIELNNNKLACF